METPDATAPPKIISISKEAKTRLENGDLLGCLDEIKSLPDDEKEFWGNLFLKARALTQSGQTRESRIILNQLLKADAVVANVHNQVEIHCAIGRTWKDDWQHSTDNALTARARCLANAIRSYEQALYVDPTSYYASINLATMSLLAGDLEKAKSTADLTLKLCEPHNDVWSIGSRAEAYAVLGRTEEALEDYRIYADAQSGMLRSLCTTRKQARWIATATGGDRHVYDPAFNLPSIVVFAGHRVDDEGREFPRLPERALPAVAQALREVLERVNAGIGFSSAADGSDMLFLEAMRERKGETHITLSSPEETFITDNIKCTEGLNWNDRFQDALEYARSGEAKGKGSVSIASPHTPSNDSIAYTYATQIMGGDAYRRALHLDLDLVPLVVWNRMPGDGQGGTSDFASTWVDRYEILKDTPSQIKVKPVEVINPKKLNWPNKPDYSQEPHHLRKFKRPTTQHLPQQIKAILFADVRNFSKLNEDEVMRFTRHYLGTVSRIVEASSDQAGHEGPLICNTWGDAFYMVFNSVRDAGWFALRLQEAVVPAPIGTVDWTLHQLPPDLSIRIALHAGPVFQISDPVIRTMSFTGRHVSFAARLEPATPPGYIYSSQAFAAYAALENVSEFRCEYVGIVPGAKKFGDIRAYRVASTKPHSESD